MKKNLLIMMMMVLCAGFASAQTINTVHGFVPGGSTGGPVSQSAGERCAEPVCSGGSADAGPGPVWGTIPGHVRGGHVSGRTAFSGDGSFHLGRGMV